MIPRAFVGMGIALVTDILLRLVALIPPLQELIPDINWLEFPMVAIVVTLFYFIIRFWMQNEKEWRAHVSEIKNTMETLHEKERQQFFAIIESQREGFYTQMEQQRKAHQESVATVLRLQSDTFAEALERIIDTSFHGGRQPARPMAYQDEDHRR